MRSRLDAELVANLMNEVWARLDIVITERGGRMDEHMRCGDRRVGDERGRGGRCRGAVRTGLALQETLEAFVAQAGSPRVAIRVGHKYADQRSSAPRARPRSGRPWATR